MEKGAMIVLCLFVVIIGLAIVVSICAKFCDQNKDRPKPFFHIPQVVVRQLLQQPQTEELDSTICLRRPHRETNSERNVSTPSRRLPENNNSSISTFARHENSLYSSPGPLLDSVHSSRIPGTNNSSVSRRAHDENSVNSSSCSNLNSTHIPRFSETTNTSLRTSSTRTSNSLLSVANSHLNSIHNTRLPWTNNTSINRRVQVEDAANSSLNLHSTHSRRLLEDSGSISIFSRGRDSISHSHLYSSHSLRRLRDQNNRSISTSARDEDSANSISNTQSHSALNTIRSTEAYESSIHALAQEVDLLNPELHPSEPLLSNQRTGRFTLPEIQMVPPLANLPFQSGSQSRSQPSASRRSSYRTESMLIQPSAPRILRPEIESTFNTSLNNTDSSESAVPPPMYHEIEPLAEAEETLAPPSYDDVIMWPEKYIQK